MVRRRDDGGNSWTTSDEFHLAFGQGIEAFGDGVVGDGLGNVFVIGHAKDAGQVAHSVIRKLAGPPRLSCDHSGGQLLFTWPSSATGFVLQSATTLANGGDWQDSSLTPTGVGDQNVVTVDTTGASGFFRLRGP